MDTRSNIVEKFNTICSGDDSKKIEESIFKFVNDYCDENHIKCEFKNHLYKKLYINKSRDVFSELNPDSYVKNTEIANLIKNKRVKLEKIATYKYNTLRPKKWGKYKYDIELLNNDIINTNKDVCTTSQFTCPKCKKNKCVYSQFQIRSADEPITSFITCLIEGCGHNWRE